jgi:transcriptional repressor NrdR
MNCPKCNSNDTKVYDSRTSKNGKAIRRRRECLACTYRFTTIEEVKILDLNIKKRNGQITPFLEKKLESGIRKAFNKRPVDATKVQAITQQVLEDILKLDQNPISSKKVGKLALKHLKTEDKVAFICYSAMFSNFTSVDDFIQIIKPGE